ncbi:MAG TPA: 50S ribosomal protein L23 [Gammaproteobacteria bacterium]|nr:50S ribosomal protein L23 [Gammaproteobacteria bacterium]
MNSENLMNVILGPHITEKAAAGAEEGRQVVFKVRRDADKQAIRRAVEQMFNVKVEHVRVAVMHGKLKRFGAHIGRRSDWKKAYVTLAEGQKIDFMGGE